MTFARRPSVGSIPLRKSRLPVCTASAYVPNGSGGAGSLISSSFNRCSALAGGGLFRIADCAFEFAFICLCPTRLKSMLPAVAWQGSDHLSSTDRSVQLTQWSEYRASRPPKVPVVPTPRSDHPWSTAWTQIRLSQAPQMQHTTAVWEESLRLWCFAGQICSVKIVRGGSCSPPEPALPSFLYFLDLGCRRRDIPTAFPHSRGTEF